MLEMEKMKKGPLHLRKAKDSAEVLREEQVFFFGQTCCG